MKLTIALSVVLGMVAVTPVLASDILMGVMISDDGTQSIHQMATTSAACASFLELFRQQRDGGGQVSLSFHDPEYTGIVVEAFCIRPDGSVVGPDGPVTVPTR